MILFYYNCLKNKNHEHIRHGYNVVTTSDFFILYSLVELLVGQ